MKNYQAAMKDHLAKYRKQRLGVFEDGVWNKNNKAYPHILPTSLELLNLLEHFRFEIQNYLKSNPKLNCMTTFALHQTNPP